MECHAASSPKMIHHNESMLVISALAKADRFVITLKFVFALTKVGRHAARSSKIGRHAISSL